MREDAITRAVARLEAYCAKLEAELLQEVPTAANVRYHADLHTVLAALRQARADAERLNERYARLARKAKVYRRQMRGQQLALERQQREVERLMLLGIQTARNNAIDAARAAGGTNG